MYEKCDNYENHIFHNNFYPSFLFQPIKHIFNKTFKGVKIIVAEFRSSTSRGLLNVAVILNQV